MTGCSVSADTQRGVEVLSSYSLDNALKETSGLFCIDGGAFSINDSGNKPELFTINELGKITGKAELDILAPRFLSLWSFGKLVPVSQVRASWVQSSGTI